MEDLRDTLKELLSILRTPDLVEKLFEHQSRSTTRY